MRFLLLSLFIMFGTVSSAMAQPAAAPNFHDKIPKELFERKDTSFITFTSENDLYSGNGADENYTNGARFTYYDTGRSASRLIEKLDKFLPFFNVNETTNTYFSLGQNMYTPRDITARIPDSADRPYAGFLYGSVGSNTINENHMDDVEITFGVVGLWALGEPIQKFVHQQIDSPDPKGWDHQLENEPGLMVAYQRSWPEAFAADLNPFYVRVAPHLGATLGNIYTYGAAGVTLQITPSHAIWQAPPPRVRPAMPGSGYFAVPDGSFAWSLFAGVEGRAMARNIFLDGNTFRDSASVDREIGVLDANAGLTLAYDSVQVAYTLNWRSREYEGQRDNSLFGSVSLGYRF
ncbi:MAG: lipid A deacylase LpxR family protein [Rickettsiales bacterium]|nr:lipid A deacylase LpxR family protein [Rickettsiales bacterium]